VQYHLLIDNYLIKLIIISIIHITLMNTLCITRSFNKLFLKHNLLFIRIISYIFSSRTLLFHLSTSFFVHSFCALFLKYLLIVYQMLIETYYNQEGICIQHYFGITQPTLFFNSKSLVINLA